MDPVTQGALGAAVTQSLVGKRLGKRAWWLGAWGGMAADLDVLLRWPGDPMVALTFHRHFTHSLSFIPVGGLLCALPFLSREWAKADRRGLIAATTIGYATHATLDAFTSYGTLLGWPFSNARVAWNTISIIDPLYTLPLILGVWMTRRSEGGLRVAWARAAFAVAFAYMALCGLQRSRVRDAQATVLAARGHSPADRFTFPLIGTNLRWRSLYRVDNTFYADAFDVPWFSAVRYLPGETAPAFDRADAPPELSSDPTLSHALDVIEWFTAGRMVIESVAASDTLSAGHRICDLRYSSIPEGFKGVFCFELRAGTDGHPASVSQGRLDMGARDKATLAKTFPGMGDPGWQSLPPG